MVIENILKKINFLGCMRNLRLNGKAYPLTVESGWRGLSIDDCDGTACGGEVRFYLQFLVVFSK